MKTLLTFFLFALSLGATCTTLSTGRHYCPTTGDPVVDGDNLRTFLVTPSFACGDTIILDSGATYIAPSLPGVYFPFVLAAQTGCLPGQMTHIVSTRAKELYNKTYESRCTNVDSQANYTDPACTTWPMMNEISSKMATLKAPLGACQSCAGSVLSTYPGPTNNYILEGIAFTTDSDLSQVDHTFSGLPTVSISAGPVDNPLWPNGFSHDVKFLHCLVTNGEEQLFGTLAKCKTIACGLRGSAGAFAMGGRNLEIIESSAFGQGGFVPNYGSVLSIITIPVDARGTGYAVGNTGTFNGGRDLATYQVTTIDGSGGVTGVTITYGGFGYGGYNSPQIGTTATSGVGTGFQPYIQAGDGVHYSVTAATNAVSPAITVTGIANLLNITPDSGGICVDPDTARPRCTAACLLAAHCERITAQGFPGTGQWNNANGTVYGVYKTANSVYLTTANFAELYANNTYQYMLPIDTTAAGAYAGGAVVRPSGTSITPLYNLNPQSTNNLQFIRSYIANGDMTYFGGSGGRPTSYGFTTGSTWDGVDTGTLSVTVEAGGPLGTKIGQVVAFETATQSVWCNGTPTCPANTQTGIIESIAGTFPNLVLTLRPWGPTGMDTTAVTGGGRRAVWDGLLDTRVLLSESTIYRDPYAFPVGKGAYETKNTNTSLYSGNLTPCMFYEGKDQSYPWLTGLPSTGGFTTWTKCSNTRWSHNIMTSCTMAHMNSGDYEATISKDFNCHYEHNIAPQVLSLIEYPRQSYMDSLSNTSTANHNTLIVDPSVSLRQDWFVNFYTAIDCTNTGSFNDAYQKWYITHLNNIFSYGVGYVYTVPGKNCWPNVLTGVHNNVMLNNMVTPPSTNMQIEAAWPLNNSAVSTVADVQFECGGSCDPQQPAGYSLAAGSPFKGTADDGSDPGADMVAVMDRFNGWSRQATILEYDANTATWRNKPSAFHIFSTTTNLIFRRFRPLSSCKVTLYTDAARITEAVDTNTSGKKLCSRAGNTESGGTVTFVLGNGTPLSANTNYWYMVEDGARKMVGSFKTRP